MTSTKIEALQWLSGRWEDGRFELTFTAARAGTMLGALRDIAGGDYFEFLRLVEMQGKVTCEHFVRGVGNGTYRLATCDVVEDLKRVTFESSAPPLGRCVIWTVTDNDTNLLAEMRGDKTEQWRFRRVP